MVKSRRSTQYYILFLSIIGGIVHALWGGHVIYEAMSAFYYSIILIIPKYMYIQEKEFEKSNNRILDINLKHSIASQ